MGYRSHRHLQVYTSMFHASGNLELKSVAPFPVSPLPSQSPATEGKSVLKTGKIRNNTVKRVASRRSAKEIAGERLIHQRCEITR